MDAEYSRWSMSGRAAFVAGGSSGINLEIARAFAAAGASVAILSRDADKVAAATGNIEEAGGDVFGQAADVRDAPAVEAALAAAAQRFGGLDIIISGAAGNFIAPALDMSFNAFKAVVDIDLLGTFNVFRASFAHLRRPGASLIAITAPQGAHPAMLQAHACAAKAGVNMLTRCLAMEWGPEGVRVNAISPGPIAQTEGMTRLVASPEAERGVRDRLALRTFGEKRDIAHAALFLASGEARYITGTILDCDGGLGLGDASGSAMPGRS